MKPKVSIIMPIHNGKTFTRVAIDSILNSTSFPFELLLIESESTDGTVELCDEYAKKYDNIKVYHIPKKGLANAINYGIKKARNNDVYLTQNDVVHFRLYGRDWLLEMYENSKKKNIGILMGIGAGGVSGPTFLEGIKWVGTWNTYIPRKTIKKVGIFDENFGPGDDIDYCYRVGKAGLKGLICNFWVQHHRLTDHGESDEEKKIVKMGKYFKKKWGIK